MIDLTGYKELNNVFGGSEKKTSVRYNGIEHMLKYPDPIREKKNDLSYMNNQYSEHIGCMIYDYLGIPVQETFLATFIPKDDNKMRIVVACKNFLQGNEVLIEFGKLGLQNYISDRQITTTIEDVYKVINKVSDIDQNLIKERFWDMFVVDAFIINKDRHLDNWGFIADKDNDYVLSRIAPVYDCGSSLSATVSDKNMMEALSDENKFKNLEYNVASVYSINGNKIFYNKIFQEPFDDLKQAVCRIVPKINMEDIKKIVNSVEGMSEIRKKYLCKALEYRYDNILQPALEKVIKEEKIKELSSTEGVVSFIKKGLENGRRLDDIRKDLMKHCPIKNYVERKSIVGAAVKQVAKCSKFKKYFNDGIEL